MTHGIEPNDPLRKVGANGASGAQNKAGARPAEGADPTRFRQLLEQLEQKAEALRGRSAQVEDSGGLRDAVSEARGSLEDALKLQADLLESFRAARQSGDLKESA
jgi:hypothetical protein